MIKFFSAFATLLLLLSFSTSSFSQCTGCTTTLTASSAANINITSGVYCINATGADIVLSGDVTVNGGVLCVYAGTGNVTFNGLLTINKGETVNFSSSSTKSVIINALKEGNGSGVEYMNNSGNLTVNTLAAGSVVDGWRIFDLIINNSGTINV